MSNVIDKWGKRQTYNNIIRQTEKKGIETLETNVQKVKRIDRNKKVSLQYDTKNIL